MHCIPDHVLDAPPPPLTAFEGVPPGVSEEELPPPWDGRVPEQASEEAAAPAHGQGAAASAAVEIAALIPGSPVYAFVEHGVDDERSGVSVAVSA